MHMALRLVGAVALAMMSASTSLAQKPDPLAGKWTAVSAERDGKDAADVVGNILTFAGGKFTIQRAGKTLYAGTYRTDTARTPAEIDFQNTQGNLQGTWKGIYRLEGEILRICDNAQALGKARPTRFAAPAGSGHVLIVFERAKS